MIQPSWTKRPPNPGQAVVVLDPGLSFGTGHHPTTLYCLRELIAARRLGLDQSVLDLGTGSGILAIAAAKLGFQPVEAVDVDADCVRVARDNAGRNRVAQRIRIARQDVAGRPAGGQRRYSVVCANLITPVLLAQKRKILDCLAPGGRLVLAGVLDAEFPEVQQTYEAAGLRLVRTQAKREWRSGTFWRPC
jgi:ribosomal protein L11 methyltransferase